MSGFDKLNKWASKLSLENSDLYFVMEATGVYHQQIAYWLHKRSFKVVIVLPNKISNFAKTLDIKTVTDKTASEAITRFGLSRAMDSWQPPLEIYRNIKQLTREREQIVAERTVIKNQIHAEKAEAFPNNKTLDRLNERIKLLNKQEEQVKKEVEDLVANNEEVKKSVERMITHAGFDIKEKTSGTSVKGKPKISKKGNRYVRKAMHFPSLSAIKHCPAHKETYHRLLGRHGIKMKALVCIQRKLLELMYILFKTKSTFDADYEEKRKALPQIATEPSNLAFS
jgi:transposase